MAIDSASVVLAQSEIRIDSSYSVAGIRTPIPAAPEG